MAENDQSASLAAGDGNGQGAQSDNHGGSSDWVNGLDDGLKGVVKAKGWKQPGDAIKSYSELEKFASKSVQDMTPGEKDKFFKRLGLPESSEEYELSSVVMPEGFTRDADADKAFKELAHKLKLTKAQAKELHEYASKTGAGAVISARQSIAKKREEAESKLRGEWGADFDGNLRGAQEVIRKFGDDATVQYMNEGPGNEPRMLRFLLKIKKAMADDTLESGRVPSDFDRSGGAGMVVDFSKSPELQRR